MGIGPTQPAWKAGVLPLNYTRVPFTMLDYSTKIYCGCQTFSIVFSKFIKLFFGCDFISRTRSDQPIFSFITAVIFPFEITQ